MISFAIFVCGFLALLVLFQVAVSLRVVGQWLWARPAAVADDRLPKAAIVMSLRGADPDLLDALRSLLHQDYPDYVLQIIVDRKEDPAWSVVRHAMAEEGGHRVHLSVVRTHRNTCSRHCTALVQAIEGLDDSVDVVAIVDGDVVTHPTWLRELVAPLSLPGVGLTHGNRWFMPPEPSWGCLVRYLWNAGAVVPMSFFGIPWGGSMALRKSVLKESGLLATWTRSLVPDAPIKSHLDRLGLKVHFVPGLMMVNREYCHLPFSLDFIKRQMAWTRIYHPNWPVVLLHVLATLVAQLAAVVLFCLGLDAGESQAATWSAAGFLGYWGAMLAILGLLEWGVRRVVRARGESARWITPATVWQLPWAVLVTQVVYCVTVVQVTFLRQVSWRGVSYEIYGPFDIRVVSDSPVPHPASSRMHSHASI